MDELALQARWALRGSYLSRHLMRWNLPTGLLSRQQTAPSIAKGFGTSVEPYLRWLHVTDNKGDPTSGPSKLTRVLAPRRARYLGILPRQQLICGKECEATFEVTLADDDHCEREAGIHDARTWNQGGKNRGRLIKELDAAAANLGKELGVGANLVGRNSLLQPASARFPDAIDRLLCPDFTGCDGSCSVADL